jgi:hypothetical protein
MKLITSTYITLCGIKRIVEISKKKYHQCLIYEDHKPAYLVDFYNLQNESNAIMNSMVLCSDKSIEDVLKSINIRNHVNLSIPKISRIGIHKRIKSKIIHLDLESIPIKWLV